MHLSPPDFTSFRSVVGLVPYQKNIIKIKLGKYQKVVTIQFPFTTLVSVDVLS